MVAFLKERLRRTDLTMGRGSRSLQIMNGERSSVLNFFTQVFSEALVSLSPQ